MKKWHYLLISSLICLLDQLTKIMVVGSLELYKSVHIFPKLDFTLMYNTGSAFSFLSNSGNWHLWFFLIFSLIMSVLILVWIMKIPITNSKHLSSLAFILGGAVGNLIDRIHYGHVVDFIDVYYDNYHWPAFNLADAAITIGAVIFLCYGERKNASIKS